MPIPASVNPEKFTVEMVLFDHNDFSIVYGTWHPSNSRVIGMRWNDGDDGAGYPKAFGYPQWFVVSDDISKNILTGILNNSIISPTEYQLILDVLKTL